jgi:hypothetical protein
MLHDLPRDLGRTKASLLLVRSNAANDLDMAIFLFMVNFSAETVPMMAR